MAMAQATLKNELLNLSPSATEAAAITTLKDAYGVFAAQAQAASPILAAGVDLGKAAMASALVGMSASGAGITKIPAAIQAFWAAVAGGLATSFAGATAIVPPPHAGLAAAFASLMPSLTTSSASLSSAADQIATLFYNQAIIGGTVTTPGPTVTPIT